MESLNNSHRSLSFKQGRLGLLVNSMNDLKNLQNNIKLEQNVKILLTWN